MGPEFRIRCASANDLASIAQFNVALAWETEGLRLDAGLVRAGVSAVLNDPHKGRYFVAEADGRVIGQCCVTYEWSDWRNGNQWWLQSVYVADGWRKRGVFRGLFQHARLAAESEGVVGLRLYVEQNNLVAQETYRRLGMTKAHYLVFEMGLPPGRSLCP